MFAGAEAYDRFIGRYGTSLGEALADHAGIEAGMRVLDVGCGTGGLSAVLLARGAEVTGAEPSAPFAAAARERLRGAEIVVAPAEALPFADDAFDAALAQLVVNFMADAEAGVREMARVTRDGGAVAACVWDYGGEMTLLRAFWDAARDVAPRIAADADEARTMRWCGDGDLGGLWEQAGLRNVATTALQARAAYDSFEDLWSPLPSGVGPAGAFCASLAPAAQDALRERLHARLGSPSGPFELTARAWAVRGRA